MERRGIKQKHTQDKIIEQKEEVGDTVPPRCSFVKLHYGSEVKGGLKSTQRGVVTTALANFSFCLCLFVFVFASLSLSLSLTLPLIYPQYLFSLLADKCINQRLFSGYRRVES